MFRAKGSLRTSEGPRGYQSGRPAVHGEAGRDLELAAHAVPCGVLRTWFCGAWTRYGFHEDGILSAVTVAESMGVSTPWKITHSPDPVPSAFGFVAGVPWRACAGAKGCLVCGLVPARRGRVRQRASDAVWRTCRASPTAPDIAGVCHTHGNGGWPKRGFGTARDTPLPPLSPECPLICCKSQPFASGMSEPPTTGRHQPPTANL